MPRCYPPQASSLWYSDSTSLRAFVSACSMGRARLEEGQGGDTAADVVGQQVGGNVGLFLAWRGKTAWVLVRSRETDLAVRHQSRSI